MSFQIFTHFRYTGAYFFRHFGETLKALQDTFLQEVSSLSPCYAYTVSSGGNKQGSIFSSEHDRFQNYSGNCAKTYRSDMSIK